MSTQRKKKENADIVSMFLITVLDSRLKHLQ